MGAWKQLNQQDVYLTTYTAKKSWNVNSNTLQTEGIRYYHAASSSLEDKYYLKPTDLVGGPTSGSEDPTFHAPLLHAGIRQLYFKHHNIYSGSLEQSSSFDTYMQSSLETGSRALDGSALVYTIPKSRFGTHIEPGSFSMGEFKKYVDDDYSNGFLIADANTLHDDGEGALRLGNVSGSLGGTIIYPHGRVIITNSDADIHYRQVPLQDMEWKSNVPIYTYNYTVRLSDYEFNHTQNPTALTGSDNRVRNELTGSAFQPYITTVGLYNDSNELIGVGKLSKPLPKSKNTETTIQIKLDI